MREIDREIENQRERREREMLGRASIERKKEGGIEGEKTGRGKKERERASEQASVRASERDRERERARKRGGWMDRCSAPLSWRAARDRGGLR